MSGIVAKTVFFPSLYYAVGETMLAQVINFHFKI